MTSDSNRRNFLGTAAGAAAFTIVPRHVLGGPNAVPPSDKITLAYVGVGTQGLRELLNLLAAPEIQVVAVCDPSKEAIGYRDWNANGLTSQIRRFLGKNDWNPTGVIPGGRDVAKDIIDTYYSSQRAGDNFKSCATYADYRELL